jgi:hypothetical protein
MYFDFLTYIKYTFHEKIQLFVIKILNRCSALVRRDNVRKNEGVGSQGAETLPPSCKPVTAGRNHLKVNYPPPPHWE